MKPYYRALLYLVIPISVISCCKKAPKPVEQLFRFLEQTRVDARACFKITSQDSAIDPLLLELVVTEVHNPQCGGDPDTAPIFGRFQADKNTAALSQLDFLSGEYKPLK